MCRILIKWYTTARGAIDNGCEHYVWQTLADVDFDSRHDGLTCPRKNQPTTSNTNVYFHLSFRFLVVDVVAAFDFVAEVVVGRCHPM